MRNSGNSKIRKAKLRKSVRRLYQPCESRCSASGTPARVGENRGTRAAQYRESGRHDRALRLRRTIRRRLGRAPGSDRAIARGEGQTPINSKAPDSDYEKMIEESGPDLRLQLLKKDGDVDRNTMIDLARRDWPTLLGRDRLHRHVHPDRKHCHQRLRGTPRPSAGVHRQARPQSPRSRCYEGGGSTGAGKSWPAMPRKPGIAPMNCIGDSEAAGTTSGSGDPTRRPRQEISTLRWAALELPSFPRAVGSKTSPEARGATVSISRSGSRPGSARAREIIATTTNSPVVPAPFRHRPEARPDCTCDQFRDLLCTS